MLNFIKKKHLGWSIFEGKGERGNVEQWGEEGKKVFNIRDIRSRFLYKNKRADKALQCCVKE